MSEQQTTEAHAAWHHCLGYEWCDFRKRPCRNCMGEDRALFRDFLIMGLFVGAVSGWGLFALSL